MYDDDTATPRSLWRRRRETVTSLSLAGRSRLRHHIYGRATSLRDVNGGATRHRGSRQGGGRFAFHFCIRPADTPHTRAPFWGLNRTRGGGGIGGTPVRVTFVYRVFHVLRHCRFPCKIFSFVFRPSPCKNVLESLKEISYIFNKRISRQPFSTPSNFIFLTN